MFNIFTMQDPNPAAEDHSTTNPTQSFTTTDAVNPNIPTTGECWSSEVVAVRASSSVAKKGGIGRGRPRPRSVGDKEDPLKGSSSVGARRKRVWKHAKCSCPVCEPSKKHADSTHRDDVKASVEIDLKEPVAETTLTPMEGVDAAEKKKSEEEKRSGAAANGSAMDQGVENSQAEAKTESSTANKDRQRKAFAFDLNEFPSKQ